MWEILTNEDTAARLHGPRDIAQNLDAILVGPVVNNLAELRDIFTIRGEVACRMNL